MSVEIDGSVSTKGHEYKVSNRINFFLEEELVVLHYMTFRAMNDFITLLW